MTIFDNPNANLNPKTWFWP